MEKSCLGTLKEVVDQVRKTRAETKRSQNSKCTNNLHDTFHRSQTKHERINLTPVCAEKTRKSLKETSSDGLISNKELSINNSDLSCETDTFPSKLTAKKRGRKRKKTINQDSRCNKKLNNKTCDIQDSKSSPILMYSDNDTVKLSDKVNSVCTSTPMTRKFGENSTKTTPRARFSSLKFSFSDDETDNTIPDVINPASDLSLPVTPVTKSSLPSIEESSSASPVQVRLDSKQLTPSAENCEKCFFDDNETSCVTDGVDSCDDDDDDDDDLPVFNMSHLDRSFRKNDIVWVKWKNWPYFPAIVKTVYKKKKRLSVSLFRQQENYTLSYTKKNNVLFLQDSKRDEILKNTDKLSSIDRQTFFKALSDAENYVLPESSATLHSKDKNNLTKDKYDLQAEDKNITEYENTETAEIKSEIKQSNNDTCSNSEDLNTSVTNNTPGVCKNNEKCDSKKDLKDRWDKPSVSTSSKDTNRGRMASQQWEEKAIARKKKRYEWCKPLISFIKSPTMKKYLMDIYRGKIPSDLHTRYHSRSKKEKRESKLRHYGPISDDEQIDSIFHCFVEWLKEINSEHTETLINYMFDVWYPEAVVFAMKKKKKYTTKKAWDVFEKGVKLTKAELNLLHPDIKIQKYGRMNKKFHEIDELIQRLDSNS